MFTIIERESEIEMLKQRCTELKENIKLKQTESKYLERRHRDLHSMSFVQEQENIRLQNTIENLTKIIHAFR